jgi:competence protein ComGC
MGFALTKFGRTVFTLVEIMIVAAVIVLLVAVTIPGLLRTGKRRKSVGILNDFRLIDSAVAANGYPAPRIQYRS